MHSINSITILNTKTMEKKIITRAEHKYYFLNPYNGGSKARFYTSREIKSLVNKQHLLATQEDFLQLILRNPVHPN